LVAELFDILQTWIGLCEMAKVCNVSIFDLYTKGQQIKVYSQVYKKCMYDNRIVEKDGYASSADECFTGAYVFEPKPGIYDKVVPFDFSSLYPTIIIAYNVDYSTFVRDDQDIPDSSCNIIEWSDHQNCEHDITSKGKTKKGNVVCIKRRYRFLKSPIGVLPSLLQNLLDARTNTKREMKEYKKQLKDIPKETSEYLRIDKIITVLNKRQLSYKISCNSVYGSMGVHRGYLPFLPGAMCTTAWGRENIQLAAKRLQNKHHGDLVYGDTDSCYIHFPQFDKADKLWDFCLEVEEDISSIFPPPMRMAFEEVIYWQFLILTKKRYMYLDCGRDGKVAEKIGKKGVLLARRDNSAFIRMIYEEVVEMIFKKCRWVDVMKHVCDRFNNLCSGFFSHRDFVITKGIGEISEYAVMSKTVLNTDPKKRKKQIDDYYIECHVCDYLNLPSGSDIPKCSILLSYYENIEPTKFSQEEKETFRRKLGDCCWLCAIEEWRARKRGLPAHIQLAEKLRRRGQRVDAGERLEYIVTNMDNVKAKLWRKLEHPDYFKSRTTAMNVDYHYYLKLLSVQLDQLIDVAYSQEKFTASQLKIRLLKQVAGNKIKELFKPNIITI